MSPSSKKTRATNASSWIQGGESHQPKNSVRMAKARAKAVTETKTGRPEIFPGEETMRLNLAVPMDVYDFIQATLTANRKAKKEGLPTSTSTVVTALIRAAMKRSAK